MHVNKFSESTSFTHPLKTAYPQTEQFRGRTSGSPMALILPEPVHEIARTCHSVLNKCIQANQFVVVKHNVANSQSKDRWMTEVNALTTVGAHVRYTAYTMSGRAILTDHQPHIATLLSSHEPSLSIILRHETGRSLDTFVDVALMSTVPQESCYRILLQMAEALSFIHARRIIHDDVKPDNIMWSPDDCRAVLVDFGAALSEFQYSESGTPPYAAPEYLARGKIHKSDVWALGVSMGFAFRYFPLPSGNWLLPNALHVDTEDRKDMDEWLSFIMSVTSDNIDRREPLLGQMLRPCPASRISSKELLEKLSWQMQSQLG